MYKTCLAKMSLKSISRRYNFHPNRFQLINTYHTLVLVTIATFFGVYTNGFDHIDSEPVTSSYDDDVDDQKSLYTVIGVLLMLVIIVNVLWLIINIACLVGLHKRRTGPVKVYIGFATVRLLLGMASFIHLTTAGKTQIDHIITYGIELTFAAYFLMVYYVYAKQLDRENLEAMQKDEAPVTDITFIYPIKLDKEQLVA
ncbi:hypothetical protein O3G_MSEX002574 [Manduca sexta]|uniref:Uncharacterized protein n=1 Tax=Manduca sexta TaxID=7130 RepID=A0A922CEY1_MANSE|nr:hypothetical protein O3G_MSEX002574 [Manduca sexta]